MGVWEFSVRASHFSKTRIISKGMLLVPMAFMLKRNDFHALSSPIFISVFCQSNEVLKPAVVSTENKACHLHTNVSATGPLVHHILFPLRM